MKKTFFIAPALLGAIVSAHAFTGHTIDDKSSLEIKLSHTSHNRIAIEEGSIAKIFGDNQLFTISIDKTTGQAFVNLNQTIAQPTSLTVVSSSGYVQDLLVKSQDIPGEYLLLKEPQLDTEDDYGVVSDFRTMTIEFLNTVLEGDIPKGYGQAESETTTLDLPSPLNAEPVKTLEGPYDTLLIYRITNQGNEPVHITSDSLKQDHHNWVFITPHYLKKGSQAYCIVATPKDEVSNE